MSPSRLITVPSGFRRWFLSPLALAVSLSLGLWGYVSTTADLEKLAASQTEHKNDIAYLDAMSESIATATLSIGDSGQIVAANRAVHKMFGYGERELIGKNVTILLQNEHYKERLVQALTAVKEFEDTAPDPYVVTHKGVEAVRKDGSPFSADVTIIGIRYFSKTSRAKYVATVEVVAPTEVHNAYSSSR